MLSLLISLLGIFLTIFLVVGVHEYGHFITARLCGIKVQRFSIGFGKALFRWHDKKGTEYVIAPIPLGGYVKMVDENEENVAKEDLPFAFNRQPLYKRMAVIVAGPITNIIFAGFLYWLIFMVGFTTFKPIIGSITPLSIAALAGLKTQEEVIQIDHDPTISWYTATIKILERAGDTGYMQFQTQALKSNQTHSYSLNLASWHLDELKPDPLASLGIEPFYPTIPTLIAAIQKNSPAEKTLLQPGDKILAINKKNIHDWSDLSTTVALSPEKTLLFTVSRQNKTIDVPVQIGYHRDLFFKKHGYLGLIPKFTMPPDLLRHEQYGPIGALVQSGTEVKNFTELNFILLGKIIQGKVSLKSLGGPITIFETAGTALNNGFIPFASFLAFLSISIGIVNILPIPGLDGGHFLFQVIELIIRRPIPERVQNLFLKLGLIFLLVLITQAIVNDILRL